MIKKSVLFALLMILLSTIVFASEELIISPKEITISASVGKPFGDVILNIKTNKIGENQKINKFNYILTENGKMCLKLPIRI